MTIRRVADADYGAAGYYLVTAVATNRLPIFGRLTATGVASSPVGQVILDAWQAVRTHWPWVEPVAIALMPEHVHFIVGWQERPAGCRVTLGHIVGGFKAGVTRGARRAELIAANELVWQRGYDVRFLMTPRRLNGAIRYVEQNARVAWEQRGTDSTHCRSA